MENSQSSIDNRLSSIPGVCTCKTIDERKIRIKRRVERAEMSDGSHTSFYLLECGACTGLWGFPEENFLMAVDGGWKDDQPQTHTDNERRETIDERRNA